MSKTFLLDRELVSTPVSVVYDRQKQIADTWDHYNLDPNTTVTIGGSALAMYGMDARPNELGDTHTFDTDVITDWVGIKKIMHKSGCAGRATYLDSVGDELGYFPSQGGNHPIDAMQGFPLTLNPYIGLSN